MTYIFACTSSIHLLTMSLSPLRTCRPFSHFSRRGYAIHAPGPSAQFQVFNRRTKWLQKERAAKDVEASRRVDYLKDEVAARLCERLLVYCACPGSRKAH